LALGDDSLLFNESQSEDFNLVLGALANSSLPALLTELTDANRVLKQVKKKVQSLKANIARSMTEGIE
jgi:hypothetical protein